MRVNLLQPTLGVRLKACDDVLAPPTRAGSRRRRREPRWKVIVNIEINLRSTVVSSRVWGELNVERASLGRRRRRLSRFRFGRKVVRRFDNGHFLEYDVIRKRNVTSLIRKVVEITRKEHRIIQLFDRSGILGRIHEQMLESTWTRRSIDLTATMLDVARD